MLDPGSALPVAGTKFRLPLLDGVLPAICVCRNVSCRADSGWTSIPTVFQVQFLSSRTVAECWSHCTTPSRRCSVDTRHRQYHHQKLMLLPPGLLPCSLLAHSSYSVSDGDQSRVGKLVGPQCRRTLIVNHSVEILMFPETHEREATFMIRNRRSRPDMRAQVQETQGLGDSSQ